MTSALTCNLVYATATRVHILCRIPPLPHSLAQDERAVTVAVAPSEALSATRDPLSAELESG